VHLVVQFMNLDETATTLFCLIAGDDIHDTFEKIADGGYPVPFVGRCFIYTFVIIFLTSVLNVFIFLIEDAYDSAKQVRVYEAARFGWWGRLTNRWHRRYEA